MDWQDRRIKLYMEAGLALLLVLTLAIAGTKGVLPTRAEDEKASAAIEENQEAAKGGA